MEKNWNWAKAFEEHKTIDDIPEKVRQMESRYWIWFWFGLAQILVGGPVFFISFWIQGGTDRFMLLGLLLLLGGGIDLALAKIWAHVRLSMFWILWDSQNRLKAEMDRMSAADL